MNDVVREIEICKVTETDPTPEVANIISVVENILDNCVLDRFEKSIVFFLKGSVYFRYFVDTDEFYCNPNVFMWEVPQYFNDIKPILGYFLKEKLEHEVIVKDMSSGMIYRVPKAEEFNLKEWNKFDKEKFEYFKAEIKSMFSL